LINLQIFENRNLNAVNLTLKNNNCRKTKMLWHGRPNSFGSKKLICGMEEKKGGSWPSAFSLSPEWQLE